MQDELLNFDFDIYHVFVMKLLKIYEVSVASDLAWAMRKTEKKHRLPVFYSHITYLKFNKAAAKFKRQIRV